MDTEGRIDGWEAAKRMMYVYACIVLTLNVVVTITGAFHIQADNRADIQRNERQAKEIRASQFEGCERSNDTRIVLSALAEAVNSPEIAPLVPLRIRLALDDGRGPGVAPVNCREKYPPLP